jgi:alpha-tubulin suppressor-like RCC1 family protein
MRSKLSLIHAGLLGALLFQALTGGGQTVTKLAAGEYHSLFLKSDGSLWGMGANAYGELGDGVSGATDPFGTNRPEQIVAGNVTAIAAGGAHSLFLKTNGSLWAMGYNAYGQLGDGTYMNANRPKQIVASNVVAIAAGAFHSLFLKSDGSLWAMGYNINGQLGVGTYSRGPPFDHSGISRPRQIVGSNITAIAAGGYHSLFIKSDGSLWVTGDNSYGQLGDDGNGVGTSRPKQVVAKGVTAIAAGEHFSLFLKADGSLWGMGDNYYGQLGESDNNSTNRPTQTMASGITAIAAGADHSLFITNNGSLWGMGDTSYGRLGDSTNAMSFPYRTNPPPGKLWPVALQRSPQATCTVCFARRTVLYGAWETTPSASWVMVILALALRLIARS